MPPAKGDGMGINMIKEKTGEVFSIARENPPITGCTISKEIYDGGNNNVLYFSLAKNTDISAEIYPYHKLLIVSEGSAEVYTADGEAGILKKRDAILTPVGVSVGMRTKTSAVYTEITIGKDEKMNEIIKAGEVFNMAELVPYQDGKIVNMDILHNDNMKLVIMSFDEGTGLSEHAAPGEALIFALDGEGIIGYEGVCNTIKAGENFHFAKGGMHYVKAKKKFKMALLLTLD